MAFTDTGNNLFNNNEKASTTSWSVTAAHSASVGQLLIAILATDNIGTSDAETSEHLTLGQASSASNEFTKVVEYTNGSPGAANGATVSIWYAICDSAIQVGVTSFEATFNTAVTAKGSLGQIFDRDTSKTVQVMAGTKATGEAKSITSGAVTNAVEALLVRGLGIEDNENAIDTATASWTAMADSAAFTTGGGATANMACGAEFRIMTGAGAGVTSNPGGTSSGDMASAIIAFEEVASGARTLTCATASYSISGTAAVMAQGYVLPAGTFAGELNPDTGFDTAGQWTAGSGWVVATSKATGTATSAAVERADVTVTAGKSYRYSFDVSAYTAGTVSPRIGGTTGTAVSANGSYSGVIIAGSSNNTIGLLGSGFTGQIDNFSVKEHDYSLVGTTVVLSKGRPLTAGSGGYTITGTAVSFNRTYVLASTSGTYTLSGTSALVEFGHKLVAGSGSYTLSGTAAALVRGKALTAASGSYTITGTAAALKVAHVLPAGSGSYTITGTAVSLKFGHILVAAAGSYVLSGTAATLRRGFALVAGSGSYALTGTAAAFKVAHVLAATSAGYTITGTAVQFKIGHVLAVSSGSYALTGTNAAFSIGTGPKILTAASGSYILTGSPIAFPIWRPVAAASGTWTPASASGGSWNPVSAASGNWN